MNKKWRLVLIGGLIIGGLLVGLWWGWGYWVRNYMLWVTPLPETGISEKMVKLEGYKFENLAERDYQASEIKLEKVLGEEKTYTSYLFTYISDGNKVSGWANIPEITEEQKDLKTKKLPMIVMLRGYVDRENYQTGVGTWKAAGKLAERGYITLAPDFLGYGESDGEDEYPLLARFERPVTVLNLIASAKAWSLVDKERMGIWAHSNGGQVALSVLEITGDKWPTTLWAPVSKGFPESVLQYAEEMPDGGEYLRGLMDEFNIYYLAKRYSIDNYWGRIKAPIQIHQGTGDDAVPVEWSEELVKQLEDRGVEVNYYKYLNDDHNFARGNWNWVVARDLAFFDKLLINN